MTTNTGGTVTRNSETHYRNMGTAIGAMELAIGAASLTAVRMENVALIEQVGRISNNVEMLRRMAHQHAIDSHDVAAGACHLAGDLNPANADGDTVFP